MSPCLLWDILSSFFFLLMGREMVGSLPSSGSKTPRVEYAYMVRSSGRRGYIFFFAGTFLKLRSSLPFWATRSNTGW